MGGLDMAKRGFRSDRFVEIERKKRSIVTSSTRAAAAHLSAKQRETKYNIRAVVRQKVYRF